MEKPEIVRPLVWIGFTAFAALLLASFLGVSLLIYFIIACLAIGFTLLLSKYRIQCRYAILLFLTTALFFTYYALAYRHNVEPYSNFAGETHPIEAEILSMPEEENGKFYYKARVFSIGEFHEPVDFTIRLSHRESLSAMITDTVYCTVKLYDFETHPGLSSKASALAKNTVLGAYITDHESIRILPGKRSGLPFHIAKIRTRLNDQVMSALPLEEASVLSAMLIGMRDSIPEDLNNDYRAAGASHILVISGMHMSILVQFMLNALIGIGIRRRYAILLTHPAVLLFMAVSGFSSSVLRSGIMQIIWLTGLLIGRKPDSLNSLAIAALILLTANPFAIGDISFLLSFSASLGMITLSPRMVEFCTKNIDKPIRKHRITQFIVPVTSSVSAILGALPVQLYTFGTLNMLSVLTSLLVLYASAWIIRLGMPAVLLLSIPALSPAASPILLVVGLLIRYQNFAAGFIANHFPDPLYISGGYVQSFVLIAVLFLLATRWIFGANPLSPIVYVSAAVLMICSAAVYSISTRNETRLIILNNDYAQCVAVQQDDRALVLSCSGSGDKVSDFLMSHGAHRIDWLIVGSEESEIRCAEKLHTALDTENVLLPDTVYFPEAAFPYIYRYGLSLPVSDTNTLQLSAYGDKIDFEIFGNRLILNMNHAGYTSDSADILITDSPTGIITGKLTVVCSEGNFNDLEHTLSNGNYLFTGEHEAICLAFKPDGSYTVREG